MRRKYIRVLGTAFLLTFTAGLVSAASAQNDLVGVLKQKYVVTQTTINRSQITVPGTVMDIQANGINAEPWDTLVTFDNPVVNGAVQQRSGGMLGRGISLIRSSNKNLMILKPGDKVYITKIEGTTNGKFDTLKFSLLSCDPMDADGGASQKRYAATVSFRMMQGGLQQTSPEDAERMVEAVMTPDSGDSGGGGQGVAAGPAPASAPVAAAPPPPPPPSAPVQTQTIAMGQTVDQVVAIMGQPKQIIDLGARGKKYKYQDMTVVFTNGKVSDVQ